ncbi:MAG TPA: KH domain-containing protein [Firmicutes bacterium]|nr:KH domain-containing protein [Bacillota bacterium]
MVELISFMVKSLVDDKDAAKVTLTDEETITIQVAKEDLGKVIGKDGRIIKAIRTIVRAVANKQQAKYNVVIVEE